MLARILAFVAVFALLARAASATWSIILIDIRTGEIAVASATCLAGDLTNSVPVVVVRGGAACAQAALNPVQRVFVRDQLLLGKSPADILQQLAQRDPGHERRQYGIVDVDGGAVSFTGTKTGAWAGGRTGRMGDIVYALQGNVLTGAPVLAAAELAIWWTPGDLADKLMAAMQAARGAGGDGRCSCSRGPTACGSPPPSFVRSALIGFMFVARPGDDDGGCGSAMGCANRRFYLSLNATAQSAQAPDPVARLQSMFDAWVAAQRGRPDHRRSTVAFATPNLPNDGKSTTTATLVLRDREGRRITTGGAQVKVTLDPSSTASVTFGAVVDRGDGTYAVPVAAGTTVGTARLRVAVDDGSGPRELMPPPEIPVEDVPLWAGPGRLSAAAGGVVEFSIHPGARAGAHRGYVLMASNSGSSPGFIVPPLILVPLNPDPVFFTTLNAAFTGQLPELIGIVPASGLARTRLRFPPGLYGLPLGSELAFAYALWNPVTFASNAVHVRLVR